MPHTVEKLMNFLHLLFVLVRSLTFLVIQRLGRSIFVSVVRAAQPDTDQVPLNSVEWLEMIKGPVLVLINQKAC